MPTKVARLPPSSDSPRIPYGGWTAIPELGRWLTKTAFTRDDERAADTATGFLPLGPWEAIVEGPRPDGERPEIIHSERLTIRRRVASDDEEFDSGVDPWFSFFRAEDGTVGIRSPVHNPLRRFLTVEDAVRSLWGELRDNAEVIRFAKAGPQV
ncbi:MAG TPA: hypothetical protein VNZ61_08905 [Roseomonas sp.]|nr:hypothetical protein [Roseomonas sp.]